MSPPPTLLRPAPAAPRTDRDHRDHRERLARLGTLAAGIAHGVNTPLACALSALGEIATTVEAGPLDAAALRGLRDASREALAAAGRVRDVVGALRSFARAPASVPAPLFVEDEVQVAIALSRHAVRDRARLHAEFGPTPPVRAAPGDLSHVVVNLLVNAAQAIPRDGARGHEVHVTTRTREDGRVEIAVRDSGRGIDPADLPRIFEPFFTTKPVGEGTGLGLSICARIVRGAGGEIQVESRPGAGATFRVILPPAPTGEPAPG